ncbi:MAG: pitrilysin family protein [Pseudomonadota bacterium]
MSYPRWMRCTVGVTLLNIVLLVDVFAAAIKLPEGVTQGPSVEGITEYRLDNGLKVLLMPDMSKPTITVNVTYLVGSRHENVGETGMAHLLEHLMFKGTPKNPSVVQEFSQRGMRFNGTTSLDRTNYYEFFQASNDNLKWAIEMEADRMTHSYIARKDLDSEMTVVRNEFENGENSPFSLLMKRMQSVAYDWHNYGKATIGNRSDIEHVDIAHLQNFYRTYYQPDNAVLLIAGKFDAAQTLEWVNAAFGTIAKPTRVLPPFWTVEPTQDGERSFTVRRKGDVQMVGVAYKVPGELHPDSAALTYMSDILTDTPNGRLHKSLVESGLATQVFGYAVSGVAPGLHVIAAVVKKDQPIEPVRDALIQAIESFSKTAPTAEEMTRVRRSYDNDIESTLNDHQKIGVALSEAIALGDWRLLFQQRDQLNHVRPEQVSAAAARYLKRDNRTVGNFLPEDAPQRAEIPVAPDVAEVMKNFVPKQETSVAEAFEPTQSNIDQRTQRSKIGNLKLALLPKKNRGETVAVQLSLRWGDEKNLFNRSAVMSMTDAMLTRGTGKFSREQLADEFDRLKIKGDLYRFETTRSNLPEALRLVAHVLQEPSFPAAQFEQLKQQKLVNIASRRNDPQSLAGDFLGTHFNHYPQGDIRAYRPIEQQLVDIKALELADIKAFHKEFYGASHGEIAVVGDFDAAEIKKVLEQTLGRWPSKAVYARIPHSHVEIAPTTRHINAPDKENGYYLARLNLALNIDDADYPALVLANYLFGDGGLKSRLMDRIRQKDGLSYGGGSSLDAGQIDRAGSFSISAIAAPQNLARLDTAVKEELARVLNEGFTAEEVARAKSGILQQRSQTRSQDKYLTEGWVTYMYLDRTYAWSKQYEDKLSALTVEQVNSAFRKAIDPAQLTVVTAGDEAKALALKVEKGTLKQ